MAVNDIGRTILAEGSFTKTIDKGINNMQAIINALDFL